MNVRQTKLTALHALTLSTVVSLLPAGSAIASTPVSWIGATDGQWTTASRWTGGVVPITGDDAATVDATGTPYTVTLANQTAALAGLTVNAADATVVFNDVDFTGPSITVNAGRFRQAYGSLNDVTLNASGDGAVGLYSSPLAWNNVTLGAGFRFETFGNGPVIVGRGLHLNGTSLRLLEGINFYFDASSLDGSGDILVSHLPNTGGGTASFAALRDGFSIGSGITLRTADNNGPGGALYVGTSSTGSELPQWTNYGTLACDSVAGGSLHVGGAWTNAGLIRISNGLLQLDGKYTTAGLGTIVRTGGAVLVSGTLDNTNATLNVDAARSAWTLNGVNILGGRIESSGSNGLTGSSATFTDTTLAGTVNIKLPGMLRFDGSHFTLDDGGISGASVVNVVAAGVDNFSATVGRSNGSVQVDGSGEFRFIGSGVVSVSGYSAGAGPMQFGAGIRLRAMTGSGARFTYVSIAGQATAEGTGSVLNLSDNTTITGSAVATGGGQIILGTPYETAATTPVNVGTISADAASTIAAYRLNGAGGHLNVAGTLLVGDRSTSTASTFHTTDASIDGLNLTAGASVEIDVALKSGQVVNDTVKLTGATTLAGGIRVRPLQTYVPLPGTRLHVVTLAGATTGAFTGASDTLTNLPGLRATIDQTTSAVDVVFSATPGDANLDASVNFADLLILAKNYNGAASQTWLGGDFDASGTITFADLLSLAKNYGAGTTTGVDASSFADDWSLARSLVPEPATLAGLFGGAMSIMHRARRR